MLEYVYCGSNTQKASCIPFHCFRDVIINCKYSSSLYALNYFSSNRKLAFFRFPLENMASVLPAFLSIRPNSIGMTMFVSVLKRIKAMS